MVIDGSRARTNCFRWQYGQGPAISACRRWISSCSTTRVELREVLRSRLFSDALWKEQLAWRQSSCGLGVLVLGPTDSRERVEAPRQLRLTYRLADYERVHIELDGSAGALDSQHDGAYRRLVHSPALSLRAPFQRVRGTQRTAKSPSRSPSSPSRRQAGGQLLSFVRRLGRGAREGKPCRHSILLSGTIPCAPTKLCNPSAEGTMLLEFYRRGHTSVLGTVSHLAAGCYLRCQSAVVSPGRLSQGSSS